MTGVAMSSSSCLENVRISPVHDFLLRASSFGSGDHFECSRMDGYEFVSQRRDEAQNCVPCII